MKECGGGDRLRWVQGRGGGEGAGGVRALMKNCKALQMTAWRMESPATKVIFNRSLIFTASGSSNTVWMKPGRWSEPGGDERKEWMKWMK